MADPKFPDVKVKLVGEDSNAFTIVARVRRELERKGHKQAAKEFFNEALSGDYNHVLTTVQEYVTVK